MCEADAKNDTDPPVDPHLITARIKWPAQEAKAGLVRMGFAVSKTFCILQNLQEHLINIFTQADNLCFCSDIGGLFMPLGYVHDPQQRWHFIHSTVGS